MEAAIVLLIVGATIFLVDLIFNKNPLRVKLQKKTIKENLDLSSENSVEEFLDKCHLSPDDRQASFLLLSLLSNILEVAPGKIARDTDMQNLIGYYDTDAQKFFLPFADDLMDGLTKISDKKLWKKKWSKYPELPKDEDDFIELLMKMTLKEFLEFFSPLIKRDYRGR